MTLPQRKVPFTRRSQALGHLSQRARDICLLRPVVSSGGRKNSGSSPTQQPRSPTGPWLTWSHLPARLTQQEPRGKACLTDHYRACIPWPLPAPADPQPTLSLQAGPREARLAY